MSFETISSKVFVSTDFSPPVIKTFPSLCEAPKAKSPFGKVLNVLGPSGDHNVEMHAILFEYGLPFDFPSEVKKEASSMSEGITKEEISKRRDFRDRCTFTIYPDDAKDFDDAISVRNELDFVEIGVHIADVSHFVKAGSALDREALKRGR